MHQTRRRHLALIGAALAAPALPRLARAQAGGEGQRQRDQEGAHLVGDVGVAELGRVLAGVAG